MLRRVLAFAAAASASAAVTTTSTGTGTPSGAATRSRTRTALATATKTTTSTQSVSPSFASPTQTPTQTPTASAFPLLVVEDTWAVIDTSNTSTTGSAPIPATGLLFRDVNSGGLYLQLQAVTPCNATANPAFGGCPFGTAADLVNAWSSGGARDSSYGYYPNVASEGTTRPDGTGNLPLNVRRRERQAARGRPRCGRQRWPLGSLSRLPTSTSHALSPPDHRTT